MAIKVDKILGKVRENDGVNKADLVGGKVPASQLPSYVDDVIEVANYATLPITGEASKIYVTIDDNKTYRWTGTIYTEISVGTDERVKYNSSDTTSGYLSDKVVAGTGIGLSEGTVLDVDKLVITNSAPDQTVAITAGTNITSVTGTYPNFTINAATQTTDISSKVTGPATNTADYIPQRDGVNSKTLKNGLAVPAGGLAGLTALGDKVDSNTAITGATKTKITYDAKGLVTAGADATTADIADSTDKRYITDAQESKLDGLTQYTDEMAQDAVGNSVGTGLDYDDSTGVISVDKTELSLVKGDVGLGNVDNTSDANKPVSTAQQTALDGKVDENTAITGATKTKITYDAKGLVTAGADATTADIADSTDKRYITDAQESKLDGLTQYTDEMAQDAVGNSVGTGLDYDDSTGVISVDKTELSLVKGDVGLGNVDNTSDANKPVSTAQQTALDGKVDENTAITGATKTKITYDAKGLVTAGADATTADIADSTDKRYVTDAQLTVIGNTSGTNTGNQTTMSGISDTKANFNTSLSDGNFMFSGDAPTSHASSHAVGGADAVFPADPGADKYLKFNNTSNAIEWADASSGSGTVTSVSVTTANGVSGTVATDTTTPAISLTLGDITPTSVNGLYLYGKTTSQRVSIGLNSGQSGTLSVAVGQAALNSSSGAGNVAIGFASLSYPATSFSKSIGLGYYAGRYNTESDAFYVDSRDRTNTAGDKAGAILYGVMSDTPASQTLKTNSAFTATYGMTVPAGQTYKINGTPLSYSDVGAQPAGTYSTDIHSNITALNAVSGTNTGDQDLSGLVAKSTYDAHSILAATTDDTPAAVAVAEQTVVGRKTGGNIKALSTTEIRTLINVADGANANVYASITETNTGTENAKSVTPDGLAGSALGTKGFTVIAVDAATSLTVADGKAYIPIPECFNGMNLVRANAYVNTAGTTNATTIDIYNVTDSQDMLSTAISIASGGTAGTAGTVNTSYDDVATGDILRVDVTSMSTTAPKGLMVVLEFRLP